MNRCLLAVLLIVVAGCGTPIPKTAFEKAEDSFKSGNWDEAITQCDALIEHNPKDAAAYLLRGQARLAANRLDPALADMTTAIELDPSISEAYYQRAEVKRALGFKREEIQEDLIAAREHDPLYKKARLEPDDPLTADPMVRSEIPSPDMIDDTIVKGMGDKPGVDEGGLPPGDENQPRIDGVADAILGPPPSLHEETPSKGASRRRDADMESTMPGSSTANNDLGDTKSQVGKMFGDKKGDKKADNRRPSGSAKKNSVAADRSAKEKDSSKKRSRQMSGIGIEQGTARKVMEDPLTVNTTDRNLQPFSSSTMRPTGIVETPPPMMYPPPGYAAPRKIDPYGGLSGSSGRGSAYGTQPGQTTPRSVGNSPYLPGTPPGNRYDGGYQLR